MGELLTLTCVRNGILKSFLRRTPNVFSSQKANICGRAMRGGPLVLAKPFDYLNDNYGVFRAFLDKTTWRFNENSKIVVVEGPIAAGKTAFAKALAEDLDMLHLPESTMDDYYINSYGFDLRTLDSKLPESCKSFDAKDFCQNPYHRNAGTFQMYMFMIRYAQYIDALAHLMNTGQGVVLERCVYSDYVFLEAMVENGFLSKGVKSVYDDLKKNVMVFLMRPHLVIYLDVPVPKVQERIKKRSLSYEVNSKAYTPGYLTSLEKFYKQDYLNSISKHAELLVYDWSEGGEVEAVVEDIERIDFDRFERHDPKLHDWRFGKEWDLCEKRIQYTQQKEYLMTYFNVPRYDVPELVIEASDFKIKLETYEEAPGMRFIAGFNPAAGDKVLFKMKPRRSFNRVF